MVDEMVSESFNPEYVQGFALAWLDIKHRFILYEGELKE